MCNKSEQMLVIDSESVGYPAEEQRSNITTVNCLFAFESGMRNCIEDSALMDHKEARANIFESLNKVETLIRYTFLFRSSLLAKCPVKVQALDCQIWYFLTWHCSPLKSGVIGRGWGHTMCGKSKFSASLSFWWCQQNE
jgi:hypothetical protein